MFRYRIYFLNESGHVLAGEDIEALDDFAALEAAKSLSSDCAVEVWQSTRCVARFPKNGNAMPLAPSSDAARRDNAEL